MKAHVEDAVSQYLKNFEQALGRVSKTTREDALRDAEEFLRSESQDIYVSTQQEAYDHFVSAYGDPATLAGEYEESKYSATKSPRLGQWKRVLATVALLLGVTGGVGYAMFREPPKLSPFTKVEFEGEKIWVDFDDARYEWLAVNNILVSKIVTSAKSQFDDRWQKRIAEDVVEVLWGMNHFPGKTVQLRLRDPDNNTELTIADAAMTHRNRALVWKYRHDNEVR